MNMVLIGLDFGGFLSHILAAMVAVFFLTSVPGKAYRKQLKDSKKQPVIRF